jgi:hypothetical protein
MMGKGAALADTPYQQYGGQISAGASGLQNQAFQGLGSIDPSTFTGSYNPGASFTDAGVAQQYMNPYLEQSLAPQLDAARSQAEISRINDAGRLTKAGAYGGSRQAIMEAQGNAALAQQLQGITGAGYKDAYDKGANQFNIEQGRGLDNNRFGLAALDAQMAGGDTQRGIAQEGIAANMNQFAQERDDPFKKVQYMQSLLQDLPISTQDFQRAETSNFSNFLGGAGGAASLWDVFFGGGS